MRILVTGAAGFIGRAAIRRLAAHHDVVGVAHRPADAFEGVEILSLDLARGSLEALPDQVDAIVHLAQSRHHRQFPEGAEDMAAVNVAATCRMLEYARRAGAGVFILASTGSVYSAAGGQAREDGSLRPAGFYAATKVAAETLCLPYGGLFRVACLRLWTPYGPGQQDRLVPAIVGRVSEGRAVELDGEDGLSLFPTHVDDVAACLDAACASADWSGAINVAGPERISLRVLAETVGRLVGRPPQYVATGRPPPAAPEPDLGKLRVLVAVDRFIRLEEGLRDILAGHGGGAR